ncbi:MAG: FkbM family methyltransferase [Maricaulaceae bacterium]
MIKPLHIQANAALTPPFGSHSLAAPREAWRLRAAKAGAHQIGRWYISFCRKRALKELSSPFDVDITPEIKARLYPEDNRCEKRALAGVQIWDFEERNFMKAAISDGAKSNEITPFVFLDVGANVGLYSLFAAHYAKQAQRPINILAVEPDPENRRRLIDNARVNKLSLTVWPVAVSDKSERSSLQNHANNRGEIKLGQDSDGETVSVTTLTEIITRSELTYIDLMKLDIEGHDLRALKHLFENLKPSLYPKQLIIETGTPNDIPLTTLCYNRGYVVKGRGRLNLMLERNE